MKDALKLIDEIAGAFNTHTVETTPEDPREVALKAVRAILWRHRDHLDPEDVVEIWDCVQVRDVMER